MLFCPICVALDHNCGPAWCAPSVPATHYYRTYICEPSRAGLQVPDATWYSTCKRMFSFSWGPSSFVRSKELIALSITFTFSLLNLIFPLVHNWQCRFCEVQHLLGVFTGTNILTQFCHIQLGLYVFQCLCSVLAVLMECQMVWHLLFGIGMRVICVPFSFAIRNNLFLL